MRSRKKRLTQVELREMGVTPGRIITRYSPDGRRATVRQVVGEARPSLFFRFKREQTFAEGRSAIELDISLKGGDGAVDAELAGLSEKRAEVGDPEAAALWEASVRRHNENIRQRNRWEWVRYFDRMAANHRKLSESYVARAEALCQEGEAWPR